LSASEFRTELQELLAKLPPTTLDHGDCSPSYTATEDDLSAEVDDVSMEFEASTDDSEQYIHNDDAAGGSVAALGEREATRPDETSQDTEGAPVVKKRCYVDG